MLTCGLLKHRLSSSLWVPIDPSFRALSGRLQSTVRRHTFNKDSLSRKVLDGDRVSMQVNLVQNGAQSHIAKVVVFIIGMLWKTPKDNNGLLLD